MNRLLYRQLVPVLCHSHSNDHSKVLTPWQEGKRAENCFLENILKAYPIPPQKTGRFGSHTFFLMKSCTGFLICYHTLSRFRAHMKRYQTSIKANAWSNLWQELPSPSSTWQQCPVCPWTATEELAPRAGSLHHLSSVANTGQLWNNSRTTSAFCLLICLVDAQIVPPCHILVV